MSKPEETSLITFKQCKADQWQLLVYAQSLFDDREETSRSSNQNYSRCPHCKRSFKEHIASQEIVCTGLNCLCKLTQEHFINLYETNNVIPIDCLLCKCPVICHAKENEKFTEKVKIHVFQSIKTF